MLRLYIVYTNAETALKRGGATNSPPDLCRSATWTCGCPQATRSPARAQRYDTTAWTTRRFPGAAHNEAARKKRAAPALQFLLGR